MRQMRKDVRRRAGLPRNDTGKKAEQRAVGVDVMKRGAVVYLRVVVENVRVQPGVHALSWTTRREGTAASKEDLHCCDGVNVVVMDASAFKGNIDMVKFGFGPVKELVAASICYGQMR
jgi:hypothetical protein